VLICNGVICELKFLAPVDPTPSTSDIAPTTTSDVAMSTTTNYVAMTTTTNDLAMTTITSYMTTVSMSDMATPGSSITSMYKYLQLSCMLLCIPLN